MLTILTTMQGKARQSRRKANKTVMPRASHVTPGRVCHMLPWGARVTCYPGQSKAKESKAEASKAKDSKSKSNQTVTPRVSHVTAGSACHMLPWGARVTCYSGAPLSHGRGEDVDRKEFFFACTTRGSSQRKSGQSGQSGSQFSFAITSSAAARVCSALSGNRVLKV